MKFLRIRGHCMDCNIKLETELRRQGKWEEYERKIILRNYIAETKDKIAELQTYYNEVTKPEFLLMNEHEKTVQMMETWDVDLSKLKADIQKDIDYLTECLQMTIEQYGTGEDDETQSEEVSGTNETNS
jgi:recombinational DNA repair ATPase RecF